MQPQISVRETETKSDVAAFEVVVEDEVGDSIHIVYIDDVYVTELGVDVESTAAIEDLLRRTFQFLLRREPKERILKEFDLSAVEQYFPEYRRSITNSDR